MTDSDIRCSLQYKWYSKQSRNMSIIGLILIGIFTLGLLTPALLVKNMAFVIGYIISIAVSIPMFIIAFCIYMRAAYLVRNYKKWVYCEGILVHPTKSKYGMSMIAEFVYNGRRKGVKTSSLFSYSRRFGYYLLPDYENEKVGFYYNPAKNTVILLRKFYY